MSPILITHTPHKHGVIVEILHYYYPNVVRLVFLAARLTQSKCKWRCLDDNNNKKNWMTKRADYLQFIEWKKKLRNKMRKDVNVQIAGDKWRIIINNMSNCLREEITSWRFCESCSTTFPHTFTITLSCATIEMDIFLVLDQSPIHSWRTRGGARWPKGKKNATPVHISRFEKQVNHKLIIPNVYDLWLPNTNYRHSMILFKFIGLFV